MHWIPMAQSGEWNGETSFCKCSSIHPLQYFLTVFAYDVSLIAQDEQQAARYLKRHSQLLLACNPAAGWDSGGNTDQGIEGKVPAIKNAQTSLFDYVGDRHCLRRHS